MSAASVPVSTSGGSPRSHEVFSDGGLDCPDDVCFGAGLPTEAEYEMRCAAAAYDREAVAERHLRHAFFLAPEHPATHIGLYRFFFYRNRLADGLATGFICLELAARLNDLPHDWRTVGPHHAEFGGYSALPRFYLFTLKACAYLHLRLGDLAAGSELLGKLAELDPADRIGGSVLREVLARLGEDDDE